MNIATLCLITGVSACVVAASFEAGRRSAVHASRSTQTTSHVAGMHSVLPDQSNAESAKSLIEIEKIGDQSFTEVYPMIRGASSAKRAAWAKAIDRMPDTAHKRATFGMFYKTLVQIDPEEAIGLAMNLQPDLTRLAAATTMQAVMPYPSMGNLIKLMQTLPRHDLEYEGGDDFTASLSAWSAVDPIAAAKFIRANPEEDTARHRVALVRQWAAYDPTAAQKWLEQNPVPSGPESAEADPTEVNEALLQGWYDYDPAKAIDFAVANQGDVNFAGAIASVAKNVFRESPETARQFVSRLKDQARRMALEGMVSYAGAAAEEMHSSGVANIPRTVAPRCQDLANWLLQFSTEESNVVFYHLFEQWKKENRQDHLDWISELPPESQAAAIERFPAPDPSDTEQELDSLLKLSNVQLRDQIVEHILPKMFAARSEASDVLEKSDLSSAEKAHFTSLIPTEAPDGVDDDESDE